MAIPYEKTWQAVAGLNGFMAIAMGAAAAHAIADAHLAALAEKASYYQLIHAVLLLWLARQSGKIFGLVRMAMLTGIVFFCGTLYCKALTGMATTALAPLGGISFMVGWLLIVAASYRTEQ